MTMGDAAAISRKCGIPHSPLFFDDYKKFWESGYYRADTAALELLFGNKDLNKFYQNKSLIKDQRMQYTNICDNADDWVKRVAARVVPTYGKKTQLNPTSYDEECWETLLEQARTRLPCITTGGCANTCVRELKQLFTVCGGRGSDLHNPHKFAFFGSTAVTVFGRCVEIKAYEQAYKNNPTVQNEPWRQLKEYFELERDGLIPMADSLQEWAGWLASCQSQRDAYLLFAKMTNTKQIVTLETDKERMLQFPLTRKQAKQ
ncbi:unnamed protein product, partial [Amoebophrya sp. A25]|eukprot:GSA25T00025201001.1